jgi:hypothetical protein
VDELEELMVTTMTPPQKNKLASRIFGIVPLREQVEAGYHLYQQITGTFDVPMDEWIESAPGVQPHPHPQVPVAPVAVIKRIREETCVVCTTDPSTIMLDCGHMCVCAACADRWVGQHGNCPVCRNKVSKMYQ